MPVGDLVCDNVGGEGQLGWTNTEMWDEAQILRNGVLIAILNSGETTFVDTLLGTSGAGLHEYQIRPFADGVAGSSVSCSVLVDPEPVVLFDCSAID